MAEPYRVLVTGSRYWGDPAGIRLALKRADAAHPQCVLVHGKCDPRHPRTARRIPWSDAEKLPRDERLLLLGADWLADRIARDLGWEVEAMAADWDAHGKAAGFVRNHDMVKRVRLGTGECCAFIAECADRNCRRPRPHGSHGASHCAGLAEASGIETRRYGP